MFKKLSKLSLVLLVFFLSANCASAISKRTRYIKKYNFLQRKLSNIANNLKEFDKDLEFQSASFEELRSLAKKIYLKQKKVYSKIRRISKNSKYSSFTNSSKDLSQDIFLELKSNTRQTFSLIKKLQASSDKQSLFEEIYQLEKNNQELLEEISTLFKSAAFGDPGNSGVFGAVSLISGNCQPNTNDTDCSFSYISTTIKIRNLTPISDSENFVYYQFGEEALYTATSDRNGNFNLDIEPGVYSIFVLNDGKEYCSDFDAEANACKLTIEEGKKTEYNVTIDHAFW